MTALGHNSTFGEFEVPATGHRGKTEIIGLTVLDIHDCRNKTFLKSHNEAIIKIFSTSPDSLIT